MLVRFCPCSKRLEKENVMATPTIQRKKGKIVSVYVQPFHAECRKGGYTYCQSPGLFTRIIPAIVAPRNTSSDINRLAVGDREIPGWSPIAGINPLLRQIFSTRAPSGRSRRGSCL